MLINLKIIYFNLLYLWVIINKKLHNIKKLINALIRIIPKTHLKFWIFKFTKENNKILSYNYFDYQVNFIKEE